MIDEKQAEEILVLQEYINEAIKENPYQFFLDVAKSYIVAHGNEIKNVSTDRDQLLWGLNDWLNAVSGDSGYQIEAFFDNNIDLEDLSITINVVEPHDTPEYQAIRALIRDRATDDGKVVCYVDSELESGLFDDESDEDLERFASVVQSYTNRVAKLPHIAIKLHRDDGVIKAMISCYDEYVDELVKFLNPNGKAFKVPNIASTEDSTGGDEVNDGEPIG